MITCDEIVEETSTIPTKAVLAKSTTTNFYILLVFLLIVLALMIVVCIYLIKHQLKEIHLLPYDMTNNKLK